jgi:hypothetical protein
VHRAFWVNGVFDFFCTGPIPFHAWNFSLVGLLIEVKIVMNAIEKGARSPVELRII